jgi:hypothetical protein
LNFRELELNCLQPPFYTLAANSIVNILLNSAYRAVAQQLTIPRLFVAADVGVIEALPSNGRLLCFRYSGF